MRKYSFLVILSLCFLPIKAQIAITQQYKNYIDRYKDLAIEEMQRHKIPASITLAQGLLESGAGQSTLVKNGNNHFGIKCHSWTGATINADDDAEEECFRAYKNAFESYEDHSKFLKNNTRYSSLFNLNPTDYHGWANGLKACGYATNPQYATKLIQIIETYKLYQYDNARTYNKFLAENAGNSHSTTASLHPIYIYNKNYYLIARAGDTFYSIGKETDISYKSIAKANELPYNYALQAGDIVYLKKKQKRAEKQFKDVPYIVKAGDSMYSIAQKYGIRLESLYNINALSPDYNIAVGDKLKVF